MESKTIQTYYPLDLAIDRAVASRDRGAEWIIAHIDKNGQPEGFDKQMWTRVSWALGQAGKLEAASRVMAWAEKSGQLGLNGQLAKTQNLYKLSHISIGAWVLHRYDIARIMMRAASLDSAGGALRPQDGTDISDFCYTMQVGYAAVLTGDKDIADACYGWLVNMMKQQPELDKGKLYIRCVGDKLVTDVPKGQERAFVVDFNIRRQEFYNPGIAAAFLAGYAQERNLSEPLDLAEKLLDLNINGTEEQYTDLESCKICKYGWGAAAMLWARPEKINKWLPDVVRLASLFADWQNADGSWDFSAFAHNETYNTQVFQKMGKTAEHVMELNNIIMGLGYAKGIIGQ